MSTPFVDGELTPQALWAHHSMALRSLKAQKRCNVGPQATAAAIDCMVGRRFLVKMLSSVKSSASRTAPQCAAGARLGQRSADLRVKAHRSGKEGCHFSRSRLGGRRFGRSPHGAYVFATWPIWLAAALWRSPSGSFPPHLTGEQSLPRKRAPPKGGCRPASRVTPKSGGSTYA
jgi:hypothetical protein